MSNKEKRKDIPSGPGNEDKEIYDMEEKINAALDKITAAPSENVYDPDEEYKSEEEYDPDGEYESVEVFDPDV